MSEAPVQAFTAVLHQHAFVCPVDAVQGANGRRVKVTVLRKYHSLCRDLFVRVRCKKKFKVADLKTSIKHAWGLHLPDDLDIQVVAHAIKKWVTYFIASKHILKSRDKLVAAAAKEMRAMRIEDSDDEEDDEVSEAEGNESGLPVESDEVRDTDQTEACLPWFQLCPEW
jgi:hypothetical protein